jgi:hypothetical protein
MHVDMALSKHDNMNELRAQLTDDVIQVLVKQNSTLNINEDVYLTLNTDTTQQLPHTPYMHLIT